MRDIAGRNATQSQAIKAHADETGVDPRAALLALMRANPRALNRNHPYERPAAQFDYIVAQGLEKAGLVAPAGRGKLTVVHPNLLEAATPKPEDGLRRCQASASLATRPTDGSATR